MVSEQRQRVIETNRSLRTIKNELESLLEKGVITESAFDSIQSLLPTESSLSAAPTPAQRTPGLPTPSSHNRASSPAPPTAALAALNVSPPPGPPSYSQSTGGGGGPPPLPGRNQPPPPASKPVIAHARALYRYSASDARDCSFERDDTIEVQEYMNADWWMGRNTRTSAEGIFPKNYVEIVADAPPQHDEKARWNNTNTNTAYPGAGGYGAAGVAGGYQPPAQPMYGAQQQPGGYPPPPGQVNPYNAHAPPMAVANEQQHGEGGESKVSGAGKKFGKKLGNAAIFGAGATIGSNIVNSIF
ncbi:SH3-domain-containing protein [Coniochaeta hoffmannii]|uniref:SH3-domain-containing protein n=1 Tax=Coniochaeta hoffmannii TaxID=91930 RepID=A0AA38SAI8_9PEZI|nr:SH3-domain-containing protein [Coniochaeta hoffmannii]